MTYEDKDITVDEAAIILGVSRPFILQLIDDDKIPSHNAGEPLKVKLKDILKYKEVRSKSRKDAINTLVAISEELRLYDEEFQQ